MTTDPTLHHYRHALPWELPAAPTNDRARRDAIPAPVSDDVHCIPTVTRRALAVTAADPALVRVVDAVCASIYHRGAISPPAVLHSAHGREIIRAGVVDGITAASGEIYCDLNEEIDRLRAEVDYLRRMATASQSTAVARGRALDKACDGWRKSIALERIVVNEYDGDKYAAQLANIEAVRAMADDDCDCDKTRR